jgi:hypothetical protein
MVRAIREIVTVGPDGRIELQASELPQGSRAEVIVLIESDPAKPAPDALEAFDALQRSLAMTPEAAEEWVRRAAEERKVSSRL